MSSRLKTVSHSGRAILVCDYSQLTVPKEWEELMLAEHKAMAAEPLNSVRSLSIMTGSRLSPEVISTMKAVTQKNKPYVKVAAIVGLNPLQRHVLMKGVERETARSWAAFDTVEDALDWLAETE
ncbi:MAG: hypothetical protein ACT4R6_12615 [Gemmatimonadaceae bacterium]